MPTTTVPRSIRVRGVTYRSPDEARVAADELEHRAEELAGELRRSGKEAEADTLRDRGGADAERLRSWARDLEADDAAATAQPDDRPAGSPPRRRRGSAGGGRTRSSSGRGGGGVGERHVARGAASALADVGRQAQSVPVAGAAVGGFADLLWTVGGGVIAIALVYALTNERGRGPAAFSQLVGGGGHLLARFISPTDPLALGRGSATDQLADFPVSSGVASSPAAASVDPWKAPTTSQGLPGFRRSQLPSAVTAGGKTVFVDSTIAAAATAIARHFGVTVTSGYRDPAHNAEVKGAPNSDHLSGLAVDFGGPLPKLQQLYTWAQGRFPYVEPLSQSKDHVHISFRRAAGN